MKIPGLKYLGTKNIIYIFSAVLLLVVISTWLEITGGRDNMLGLLETQSHTLLETVLTASRNSIISTDRFEDYLQQKLLDNAGYIKQAYEEGRVNDKYLEMIADTRGIFRINIFDNTGKRVYSSRGGRGGPGKPAQLAPVFNGEQDTLIIGLKEARFTNEFRYVAALRANNGGVVVVNLNANELIAYRKETGFGSLIKELVAHKGIIYAALQDDEGIFAGAGPVGNLDDIGSDEFLIRATSDTNVYSRLYQTDSLEVFEAVHPFYMDGVLIGVLRLGVSLEPLNEMYARIYRRSLLFGLLLVILGSVLISFLFNNQNYTNLKREYEAVEAKSAGILSKISEAVFIIDETLNILEYNNAAEKYIGENDGFPVPLSQIVSELVVSKENVISSEVEMDGKKTYFLFTKKEISGANNEKQYIILMNDLTVVRALEEKIEKSERQRAMGELAAGVAHEIRNPLNSIGVIVQHLRKDFRVTESSEEFTELTKVVYDEVKRINNTISDFLQFVKPGTYTKSWFEISELANKIELQYKNLFEDRGIKLDVEVIGQGKVFLDHEKIYQSLVNLVENSTAAVSGDSAIITITFGIDNDIFIITIYDNGSGISKENFGKIFNLYFTTKPEGTGLGLGIVQKVVYEHGGTISVESEENVYTKFTLKLPVGNDKQD